MPKTPIMYWKIGFFLSAAALIASLFWKVNRPVAQLDCPPCFCPTTNFDTIPPNVARRDTLLYAAFRDTLDIREKDQPSGASGNSVGVQALIDQLENLRGFKLAHHELSEMFHRAGCDAQVWAMLCVRPPSKQFPDGEIDLLFQVRKSGPTADESEDTFFDFTEPCPDSCP